MFDVGASLAAARETCGLSLADAKRLTCIRIRYLDALERGNFAALPGRTVAATVASVGVVVWAASLRTSHSLPPAATPSSTHAGVHVTA